jgi:hypothetical protein
MNKSRFACLPAVAFMIVSSLWMHRAAGQEIGLTAMQATEVARGYRASALEL